MPQLKVKDITQFALNTRSIAMKINMAGLCQPQCILYELSVAYEVPCNINKWHCLILRTFVYFV